MRIGVEITFDRFEFGLSDTEVLSSASGTAAAYMYRSDGAPDISELYFFTAVVADRHRNSHLARIALVQHSPLGSHDP
jgi:hypothetical protein